jgi:hypothetical protein
LKKSIGGEIYRKSIYQEKEEKSGGTKMANNRKGLVCVMTFSLSLYSLLSFVSYTRRVNIEKAAAQGQPSR